MLISGFNTGVVAAQKLYERFKDFFQYLAKSLRKFLMNKVLPGFWNLHFYGVFDVIFYLISMLVIAQGYRMNPYTGCYITLTGQI